MVTLFVFYFHTLAAVAAFTKRWQEGGWKEGLLAVGFIALIFSVGWSISTLILKSLMDEKGFGFWLDRDACSLVLLTLLEGACLAVLRGRKRKA